MLLTVGVTTVDECWLRFLAGAGAVLMGLALIVIGLVWHRIAGSTAGARTPG